MLIFSGTTFLRNEFGIGKSNRYEKTALHKYVEGWLCGKAAGVRRLAVWDGWLCGKAGGVGRLAVWEGWLRGKADCVERLAVWEG